LRNFFLFSFHTKIGKIVKGRAEGKRRNRKIIADKKTQKNRGGISSVPAEKNR